MQKSFIERVFPKPKKTILPQYDDPVTFYDTPRHSISERNTSISNVSDSRSSANSVEANARTRSAPLSASVIHHEDPFLAVDRAAQGLQRTIQSLLDFQNEALSGRHRGDGDLVSQQSLTSTYSITNDPVRNSPIPGAMPVRQPAKKRTTLRGARRGIGTAMCEIAMVKEEDLKVTKDEQAHRKAALERIAQLESKKESVQHELDTLQQRASGSESNDLRQEAQEVQNEIRELEDRLMELKSKHRHLISRAEQLENSTASELSSYQGTLLLIDKETRSFLRRPPVTQGLGPQSHQQGQDMYSLRPERRTLELAKEQWTAELDTLEQHRLETERERDALLEGVKIWRETVRKIDSFERTVREYMKANQSDRDSTSKITALLDSAIDFLEQSFSRAETKDWKLLICAIGPELESFRQARAILHPLETPDQKAPSQDPVRNNRPDAFHHHPPTDEEEDGDVPHADLLGSQSPDFPFHPPLSPPTEQRTLATATDAPRSRSRSRSSDSGGSNASLQATLRDLPPDPTRLQGKFGVGAGVGVTMNPAIPPDRRATRYAESEDDDPGPDFLLSH